MSASPEPRFGFTVVPNVLEDLLILVVSWMMTSNEFPNRDLRMEQSQREMGSSAAILEICCCCCGLKPMNLRVVSPSVIRPSKHLRLGSLDIGEKEVTTPCKEALFPASVGVVIEERESNMVVSNLLRFPRVVGKAIKLSSR